MSDEAQSTTSTPSEILRYIDDSLEKILPEDEYRKLTALDTEMAATTSRGDFHRCFRCAEWAVALAGASEHSHLARLVTELKTALHEFHDMDWAIDFGIFRPGRTVTDVELSWVDDALKVAQAVAQESGWDAVPWEELLRQLIAIEPNRS